MRHMRMVVYCIPWHSVLRHVWLHRFGQVKRLLAVPEPLLEKSGKQVGSNHEVVLVMHIDMPDGGRCDMPIGNTLCCPSDRLALGPYTNLENPCLVGINDRN